MSRRCDRCDRSRCEKKCKDAVKINHCDINKASDRSTSGFVISKPGNYVLCENVNWTVSTPESFAISIVSDDVSLDLGGHFIKQLNANLAGCGAIKVAADVKNTLIHNGQLLQLSQVGIFADQGVSCLTIDKVDVDRSCYNGTGYMNLQNGGASFSTGGIYLYGAQRPQRTLTDALNYGPSPNPVKGVVITNCKFCDLGLFQDKSMPECLVGGITAYYAECVEIKNVTVNTVFSVLQAAGVSFLLGSSHHLSKSFVCGLRSPNSTMGFYSLASVDTLIEDSVASDLLTTYDSLQDLGSNSGNGAEGIKIGGSKHVTIRRNTFQGIHVVKGNPSDPATPAHYGRANAVSVDGAKKVQCLNNNAFDISNYYGWAWGFGNTPNQLFLALIQRPVFPIGPPPPAEFTDFVMEACTFDGCRVENISVSTSDGLFAAGYVLSSLNGQVVDSVANYIKDEGTDSYGVIFYSQTSSIPGITPVTVDAVNCIARRNSLTFADTNGVYDETYTTLPTSNNVVNSNYAAFNGAGGVGPNYVINPAGTALIQNWSLPAGPAAPPVGGPVLANVSVHN